MYPSFEITKGAKNGLRASRESCGTTDNLGKSWSPPTIKEGTPTTYMRILNAMTLHFGLESRSFSNRLSIALRIVRCSRVSLDMSVGYDRPVRKPYK